MVDFTHLHVLSHYSLLRSTITVPKLLAAVEQAGMDAVALTDAGNLFGAFEAYSLAKELRERRRAEAEAAAQAAAAAPGDARLAALAQQAAARRGVALLLGCQLAVAPLGMREKTRGALQLVLLATSEQGFRDLAQLVSLAWTEGFHFEPRVDLEAIARHARELVCLTGAGDDGFLNSHLRRGSEDEARRQLGLLKEIFGDRLWVELADHLLADPVHLRQGNLRVARDCGVPVVATNWVHYLAAEDAEVHDVLLAVSQATTLEDPRRPRLPSREFWLKSPQEMAQLFADLPEAIRNTRAVVERCQGARIASGAYYLPRYPCPQGLSEAELLRQRCEEGLARRYAEITPAHRERLAFELETIIHMGFPAYFLIVADFIEWAKRRGIPVGPGRGSAAGSLVAYCLGITDLCPLRYGLLFERFLNPGRRSMPDIDIDFCQLRRDEVIDYVRRTYGSAAVAHIMTLGTMKARMAIKDVARAYGWTPEEAQELANLVPKDPSGRYDLAVCLGRKPLDPATGAWGTVEAMLRRYEHDPRARQVLEVALRLEKLGRSLGVHACGVIIAPRPVHELVPVCVVKDKVATQWTMTQVEKAGLLKMDFLGLKTMSVLQKCLELVRRHSGRQIALSDIPLDDPATFRLLGSGRTLGVFQCESAGFQALIQRLQPDRFEDLIALVALYRPGPLKANMHLDYCDRKHGRQAVEYPHPALEPVLAETYGLYIYQEQVMSISRVLCGFSPAEADDLRKAMGKKDKATLSKLRDRFLEGAERRHGFPREQAAAMWDKILGFAEYCFNKSHSACYALIAYWTAWCKANHYPAFMTANLIFEMDNKEKMTEFVAELRAQGIAVLPPDINESGWEFTLVQREGRTQIRFGFGGVKGIGQAAAEHLIAERERRGPYASLHDLAARVDGRVINKRVVEALIKVGAFDSLHPNRRALCEGMERALDYGQKRARAAEERQQTLFDAFAADQAYRESALSYPDIEDWPVATRLGFEKQLTGYWISDHPARPWREQLGAQITHRIRDLAALADGARAVVLAVVSERRLIRTRSGGQLCALQIADESGSCEAVAFAGRGRDAQHAPERIAALCDPDTVALFVGTVERRSRGPARAGDDEDEEGASSAGEDDEENGAQGAAELEAASVPGLVLQAVIPAAHAAELLIREVIIAVDAAAAGEQQLEDTARLLAEHAGERASVGFRVFTGSELLRIRAGERWRVTPTPALLAGLERIWGRERVQTRWASPASLAAS
ncbi:MAG: DNA polymerase III subunit alpha [Planctomycetota bacterium]|nr:DNA polymerase III subunit alpha [Planctomycetota bacterium]